MRKIIVFYAWQSDIPRKINHDLIRSALDEAAQRINADVALGVDLRIDSDTEGEPGTPPVTETILKKIGNCEIFVPDLTCVARTKGGDAGEPGKAVLNPNVMTEYGYALRAKGYGAMMPIMNTGFSAVGELPFDLGHVRHPITYRVEDSMSADERRKEGDSLSKEIERILRLQIAATAPPAPLPEPFEAAKAKDGPARFRAPGEPIGKRWNDLRRLLGSEQDVFLSNGPAMWLRLMPAVAGKKWSNEGLKKCAMPAGGFNLRPLYERQGMGHNLFQLKAEDGMGICDLDSSDTKETPSVAFAFRTGEVWGTDTTVLTYHPGILAADIEKIYKARFEDYTSFMTCLELKPPFHWIAGIAGVKGRFLQLPAYPPASSPFFSGPECLAENITMEGTFDGTQDSGSVLAPFFDAIFHECGIERPKPPKT